MSQAKFLRIPVRIVLSQPIAVVPIQFSLTPQVCSLIDIYLRKAASQHMEANRLIS